MYKKLNELCLFYLFSKNRLIWIMCVKEIEQPALRYWLQRHELLAKQTSHDINTYRYIYADGACYKSTQCTFMGHWLGYHVIVNLIITDVSSVTASDLVVRRSRSKKTPNTTIPSMSEFQCACAVLLWRIPPCCSRAAVYGDWQFGQTAGDKNGRWFGNDKTLICLLPLWAETRGVRGV